MTKKAYRRFLFAAAMLVITVALAFTGPAPQAAEETCEECNARCDVTYYGCLEHGYSQQYCSALARPCRIDCFYSQACMQ
jgi:hypothetical protein